MRLAELIAKRKDELDVSFRDLSQKAEAAGYPIHRAAISALTRDDMKQWPHPDTVAALSAALEVPTSSVIDACAESLGIVVERPEAESDSVRSWLALTGNRSQAEVEHLLAVARTVAEGLDEASHKE